MIQDIENRGTKPMKMLQGISGLSLVAVLMVGCTGNNDLDKAPAPKPTINQVSVAPKPATPSSVVNAPPKGLIASTQPTAIPIPKGRVDPFSSIAVAPIKQTVGSQETPKLTPTSKAQNPPTQKPQTQQQAQKPQTQQQAQKPQTQKPKNQDKKIISNASKPKSSPLNSTPTQITLPPVAPSIDLAKAVQVNGVVELGGKVSAIVKEPEQSSRSVSAGDYIYKGKVLVKRIEFNGDREGVVILEQNGVEVIKQVGSSSGPVASN
jgi:Tfp pilus assembly protein PilP